jgi:hypothetical protein
MMHRNNSLRRGYTLMNRRSVSSIDHNLRVGMQAVICGVGLLAGPIIGAAIVYLSGLWQEFGDALKTPLDSVTKNDLLVSRQRS